MRLGYLFALLFVVIVGSAVALVSVHQGLGTNPPQLNVQGSSGSVWMVGAMSLDSSAIPNAGVRGTIQVINVPIAGALAFWVSDCLSNNVWGQVGYFVSKGGAPVGFYQVWNLNTNTILAGDTTSVNTGNHTFSMNLQNGTTWAYAIDGRVFGTYNMGAESSSLTYPVYAMSEEQANATFSFPTVSFGTAMEVFKSGSWSPVLTAVSYGTAWGVEGTTQTSALRPNQISVGASVPDIPQGTPLWSTNLGP